MGADYLLIVYVKDVVLMKNVIGSKSNLEVIQLKYRTREQTWVYHRNPESKMESMQ